MEYEGLGDVAVMPWVNISRCPHALPHQKMRRGHDVSCTEFSAVNTEF